MRRVLLALALTAGCAAPAPTCDPVNWLDDPKCDGELVDRVTDDGTFWVAACGEVTGAECDATLVRTLMSERRTAECEMGSPEPVCPEGGTPRRVAVCAD